MARFHKILGLGLASTMLIASPVFAAPAKPAAVSHPVTQASVQHSVTPAPVKATTHKAPAVQRHNKHMARATQRNGKQVTYNCSLAGNMNKQACKH